MNTHKSKLHLYAFLSVLLFVLLLIFMYRDGSSLPYVLDEWHHLTLAQEFREGNLAGIIHLEAGFTLFISALWLVFPILLNYYVVVPLLLAALASFAIWKLFEDKRISILFLALYGAIASNERVLGIFFGTPLTLGIVLLLFGLLVLEKHRIASESVASTKQKIVVSDRREKVNLFGVDLSEFHFSNLKRIKCHTWLFILLVLLAGLIHPPTGVVLGLIGLIELRSLVLAFFGGVIGLLLLIVGYIKFKWPLSAYFIFQDARIIEAAKLDVVGLCGIGVLVLSIIGYFVVITGAKYGSIKILFTFLVMNLSLFKLSGISLLLPPERNMYLFFVTATLICAITTIYVFDYILALPTSKKKIFGLKFASVFSNNSVVNTLGFLFVCLVLVSAYSDVYLFNEGKKPAALSDAQFNDLLQFANAPVGRTIAFPLNVNNALELVANKQPVSTVIWDGAIIGTVHSFFTRMSCDTRYQFLVEQRVKYVLYSRDELSSGIDCDFLDLYSRTNVFDIYIFQSK